MKIKGYLYPISVIIELFCIIYLYTQINKLVVRKPLSQEE